MITETWFNFNLIEFYKIATVTCSVNQSVNTKKRYILIDNEGPAEGMRAPQLRLKIQITRCKQREISSKI